ncbi:hypothetical protein GA830_09355 [Mesorhizobium sp. NBSH29]|uniref:hypothetical protein n=1 Tax=Mesorhizobium sp. NBSH29 TaxID=2654249 RepID=UPI0018964032|nr:hypothetical protein [Mesorhizobium sp. NBSH29]QPC86921.1 hypothetical protein GA830_09355 [Mesorhizobium sp. NBSH29]
MPANKVLTGSLLALALSASLAGSASAFSTDPLNPGSRPNIILNGSMPDLQAHERMQRGLEGLRDQQQLRELDRQQIQPQRLNVPKMKPTCQKQIRGNRIITVPCT